MFVFVFLEKYIYFKKGARPRGHDMPLLQSEVLPCNLNPNKRDSDQWSLSGTVLLFVSYNILPSSSFTPSLNDPAACDPEKAHLREHQNQICGSGICKVDLNYKGHSTIHLQLHYLYPYCNVYTNGGVARIRPTSLISNLDFEVTTKKKVEVLWSVYTTKVEPHRV